MGFFDNFPWTNFHELNLDWIIKTMKAIKDSLDNLWKEFLLSRVPTGGDEGDVLTKTSEKDYAMSWKKPTSKNGLPAGGTDGQYLKKTGAADYSASWADLPESRSVPTGGVQGNVLTKTGAGDNDYNWQEPAASHDIPAGGTTGQVLKKSSDEDYATEWADESGGEGGTVPLVEGATNFLLKKTGSGYNDYSWQEVFQPPKPEAADQYLVSNSDGTAQWVAQNPETGPVISAYGKCATFYLNRTLESGAGMAITAGGKGFFDLIASALGITASQFPSNYNFLIDFFAVNNDGLREYHAAVTWNWNFTSGRRLYLTGVDDAGTLLNLGSLNISVNGMLGNYYAGTTELDSSWNKYLVVRLASYNDLIITN